MAQSESEGQLSALELVQQFAELARELRRLRGQDATLEGVVRAAVRTVPGAEAAGITVARGSTFRTLAPTGELPRQVDAIQYELRSGPCVDAIVEETCFRTGDLEHDTRWPTFGKRAAIEVGVHSMMALRLFISDGEQEDTIGALNLYATEHDAFGSTSATLGWVFATHAAIALDGARAVEQATNLETAQHSNREIGMAMGVLMSRHRLTSSQAFDLLRMASQHTHRKLRDIASEVVEIGMLDFPAAPPAGS
ncbi:MAG TPA: GAF and ANTAR domain-containing protein [Jatrophihabitans sp.]|nr:GAF and ANTAR domain-containing protein [Jatrophihabitans sp.]